jgi:hypothetical protein
MSQLDRFERRIPSLFDSYLRLGHLDAAAARRAIEQPLDVLNVQLPVAQRVSLEPGLVDAVIAQVRVGTVHLGQSGGGKPHRNGDASEIVRVEAPYLQLVMNRLWDEERRLGSHAIRLETLERLGGASHIVRTHLDTAMVTLKASEREISASLFYYMITPGGSKVAHTATDLADYATVAPQRAQEVLDHLAQPQLRIVRPVAPAPGSTASVRFEIYHDVLAPAILDWRARYLGRSALSARLTVTAIGVLAGSIALQFVPAFPVVLLTPLRGVTSALLNALALLQVYQWFFRYLRFEPGTLAVLSERRPSMAILLSLLLTAFCLGATNWASPGFEDLGSVPLREFIAWSIGVLALNLLVGALGFLLMRYAGMLADRLFKRFELGFYGVYFLVCLVIVAFTILTLVGVFPRFIRFESTTS